MNDAEEHAWVSKLLAETPPETMPPHVAARLDATLADLTEAARSETETARSETETARSGTEAARLEFDAARNSDQPERSLGRVARAVLAVAAVVVLVAGGALMSSQLSLPSGISTSGGQGTAAGSSDSESGPSEALPSGPDGTADLGTLGQSSGVASLTTQGFAAQVTTLLGVGAAADSLRSPSGSDGDLRFRAQAPQAACSLATPAGVDRTLPALLDGRPVVLQVSSTSGDRRLVRALACDGTTLASATIPSS